MEQAREQELPASLVEHLRVARDQRGRRAAVDDGTPSLASLKRWYGTPDAKLLPAPSARPDTRVRAWHAPFFALADRWQKPTLRSCYEQLLAAWRTEWAEPVGGPPPSYDACVRAYRARPEIDKITGRNSGSGLRNLTYHQQRDWLRYRPWDEIHSDGWHTHALVPRDVDGRWQAMELWHAICVSTKVVPPFSFAWSEHTDVITEHLREVIRLGGVPARWQTDSTGAVRKHEVSGRRKSANGQRRIADDAAEDLDSLAGRLGITVLHPQTVGNSQANGMAENFNVWLDIECRALATYMNPDHHDETGFLRVRRLTVQLASARGNPEREAELRDRLRVVGRGYVFTSEADAKAWFQALADKWNHKPHRALPRLRDAATGRLRHMTPLEALAAAVAAGWEAKRLSEAQMADAFRPHIRKTVRRGVVTLHNQQRYFCRDLAMWEGHEVLVVPHEDDATQVWIKDTKGRLLCVAQLDEMLAPRAETTEAYSQRKRAEAQIRAREQQIEIIAARQAAAAAIEHAPTGAALAGMWSQSIGLPAAADVVEVQARALPDPLPGPLPEQRADAPTPTGRAVNLPPLRRPLAPHEDPEVIARVMREIDEAEARRAADMAAQMAKWHADVAAADAAKAAAAAPQQPPSTDPNFDRAAAG